MTLLLDTHVWFWSLQSPDKLGRRCRSLLEDPANELVVSTISTVELGQLQAVGRLSFAGTLESWIRRGIGSLGLRTVELTHAIALLAYGLPGKEGGVIHVVRCRYRRVAQCRKVHAL